MTSGENQTKPTVVSESQATKAKARRVSQEGTLKKTVSLPPPIMTEVEDSGKSPQYVSGGEDEDGAVLLRSESPMRCVSEFDDAVPLSMTCSASVASANAPLLPNPLHHPKLRSNHIAALQLEGQLHSMRMILSRLMVHGSNKKGLFNYPVDAAALGLADYHEVIKNPMDLGTIKARLYSIAYPSREEVATDIYLVFENAMAYNPPQNAVHVAARTLRDYFEDLYVAVGGEKKALPGHIAIESAGKASGVAGVASLSRRVSFAVATSSRGEGPLTPDKASPPLISRTVSCEAELAPDTDVNDSVAATRVRRSAEAVTSSLSLGGAASLSAEQKSSTASNTVLCSAVNSCHPANGLTEVESVLHSTPQGTRARTNSFSSPAQIEVAKPTRRRRLSFAGRNRTVGHSCTSCLGRKCTYCKQGCLPLEPTLLVCNGSSCAGSKIRKGATFFIAPDGTRQYCQRCFTNLPPVLPQIGAENGLRYRRDLLKRKYDEELVENWLTCSKCDNGVHAVCAMFNNQVHSSDNYVCPGCVEPPETVCVDDTDNSAPNQEDVFSFVTGSENPVPLVDVAGSSFRLGKDVLSADSLQETTVSAFIQKKIRERLKEASGVPNAEKTVLVRILSDCSRSFQVPEVVRKHFRMPASDFDSSSIVAPPAKVGYSSKAIALFQKVDGLDVCIFCMYVQEYEGDDEYEDDSSPASGDASAVSKKRVYIAYLDSVEHFRPRRSRTDLYHELLVSYLASARVRGFVSAHIWACPPSRGNSFVFWNHPASQRTPTKERLIAWYHGALSRAIECGVVTDVRSLYESDFQSQLQRINSDGEGDDEVLHSSGKMLCPPLLEGDFWIEEAVRIHAASFARHQKSKSEGKAPNSSKSTAQLSDTPWDPCPARQIASLLSERVMTHPSSAPFRLPVNAAAMKLKDYHKIVSRPMDLGTIYSRCVHGEFHSLGELVADVSLVFQNAKKYNPPENYVHKMAIEMESLFVEELNNITSKWGSFCGSRMDPASWQSYESMNMSLDMRLETQRLSGMLDVSSTSSTSSHCSEAKKSDSEILDLPQTQKAPEDTMPTMPLEELLQGGPEAVSQRMAGKDKWMLEKKSNLPQKRLSASKKGGCKRRRGSTVPAAPGEDDFSSKRRRQTWLGEEVAASVRSMRTSFFACSLLPTETMSEKQREKAAAFSRYTSCHAEVACPGVISSRITDARHALLEFSQYRNLEFTTLRHAKFSTAVLLYHLHNHDAPGVVPVCTTCSKEIVDCRWHKVTKIEEVRRDPRKRKRPGRPASDDDKSMYQAEELCAACYAKHHKKDQFIPLHVTLSSS